MNRPDLVVLIVRRDLETSFAAFLKTNVPGMVTSFPCNGTAGKNLMEKLGLENTEKTLFAAAVDHAKTAKLLRRCEMELGIDMPGIGIALTVPLEAVGGAGSLEALCASRSIEREGDVKPMAETVFPYSLIIAVMQSGTQEIVMDAAREAGAGGGTVVHAKGTGGKTDRSFFGFAVADQKEMLLIVTNREKRNAIMNAIMEKCGIDSPCRTVLFSVPVEQVAGLRSVMLNPDDGETETEKNGN